MACRNAKVPPHIAGAQGALIRQANNRLNRNAAVAASDKLLLPFG